MPTHPAHLLATVSDKLRVDQSGLNRLRDSDERRITEDDVDSLAKGHTLRSPLDGTYALLRDVAPAVIVLAIASLIGLSVFSATRWTIALAMLVGVVGAPILLPGKSNTKLKGYDPMLMLDHDKLKNVLLTKTEASPKGTKLRHHRVSLSTPHKYFARIRQLDLTPLIRVELNAEVPMNTDLKRALHTANLSHLKGKNHIIVNILCGPRLLLRMAKYVVGSSALRKVGHLTGLDVARLLQPHERYNFILATNPMRMVLSHIGPGDVGGLYAKHALLAELGRVVFAGELWKDSHGALHINNASGTYQPETELLPKVAEFLEEALQVRVRPHERKMDDEEIAAASASDASPEVEDVHHSTTEAKHSDRKKQQAEQRKEKGGKE
jgi:hypothetical protein